MDRKDVIISNLSLRVGSDAALIASLQAIIKEKEETIQLLKAKEAESADGNSNDK